MKNLVIIFALLCVGSAWGTTYYLAPASGGGSDANNGTSIGTPWLCTVTNLPTGLVTMGCSPAPPPAGPSILLMASTADKTTIH